MLNRWWICYCRAWLGPAGGQEPIHSRKARNPDGPGTGAADESDRTQAAIAGIRYGLVYLEDT